ncbi:hypothetical protein JCM10213_006148 [Rhodosporidiobolus nylandii]
MASAYAAPYSKVWSIHKHTCGKRDFKWPELCPKEAAFLKSLLDEPVVSTSAGTMTLRTKLAAYSCFSDLPGESSKPASEDPLPTAERGDLQIRCYPPSPLHTTFAIPYPFVLAAINLSTWYTGLRIPDEPSEAPWWVELNARALIHAALAHDSQRHNVAGMWSTVQAMDFLRTIKETRPRDEWTQEDS